MRTMMRRAQAESGALMGAIGVLLARARDEALTLVDAEADRRARVRSAVRLRELQGTALSLARTVVRHAAEACERLASLLESAARSPHRLTETDLADLGRSLDELQAVGAAARRIVELVQPELLGVREVLRDMVNEIAQDRRADQEMTALLDRLRTTR